MAEPKNLSDLLYETLKDIYFAEKQILTALPKMAEAALGPGQPRSAPDPVISPIVLRQLNSPSGHPRHSAPQEQLA